MQVKICTSVTSLRVTQKLTIEYRTIGSRGILALSSKDSWVPSPTDAVQLDIIHINEPFYHYDWAPSPFLTRSAIIEVSSSDQHGSLAWTFYLGIMHRSTNAPDTTLASIFTTSLEITNGSAAKALSTVITILSYMAYYDQFPNFAETAHTVSTTYYETFLFPKSFRGFTAVLAVTIVHCLLVVPITAAFTNSTRLTTLGDHWQSISQMISPATKNFLAKSSCATDKEGRAYLKAEHKEHEAASIQLLADGGGRVGLVSRTARRRSSHGMILE